MPSDFTKSVIEIIKKIPRGKVLSYGTVAKLAGHPRGARQVVRILHSSSRKHDLPWYRVVNSKGTIGFRDKFAYEEQKAMLESEGIEFSKNDIINRNFFWIP